jgi:hypothetical protein
MTVQLLEVSVESVEPSRWKWTVVHGTDEVASGYENSRETAQKVGDSALFELLSERKTKGS